MKKVHRILAILCCLALMGNMSFIMKAGAETVESDYRTVTDWIWSTEEIIINSMSYFRKEVLLKEAPVRLTVNTSGHNYMKFYVNGELITGLSTPASTTLPESKYYLHYELENIDTAELCLAAAVHYLGNDGWNYSNGVPAFWCEVTAIYADGSSQTIVTDTTWRALKDTPYENNTPDQQPRRVSAQLLYDARKMPDGLAWTRFGYDETVYTAGTWTAAVKAREESHTWQMRQQQIPEGAVHQTITPTPVGTQEAGGAGL